MFLCKAKRIDNGSWIEGYVWRGADKSYIIPYNLGIGYNDHRISAYAYEVDDNTIISLERFMINIANAQNEYNILKRDKKLTKKAICDICVPIKDIYGLSDSVVLSLVRDNNSLGDIFSIFNQILFSAGSIPQY